MSNNNTMQTQTSNTHHNAIMEAGGKDRPPMLAPGNYVQWKSIINKYIDIKPNHELLHYCLKNPLYKFTWADKTVPDSEGIDNDIYSTVDACPNACEMWKAIERLKQGESINVKDLETNLYWEFRKFTSRDGELLESYYSRFYKMMNELVRNQCDVTNHQVNVQFLLQLQLEWQRSQQAATRNREKAIVNSPPPIYDQKPSMVAEDDEMSKDKEIDKLVALISQSFKKIYKPTNNNLRTSSNTSRTNQDNSPSINRVTGYENQRIGNVAGAKETVGITMMQKSGIQCYNCKEFRAQELEAHYMYMVQIQEVTPDAADNSGPIFDTEPLQKTNELMYKDLKKFQAELDRRNEVKYASKVEINCAKAKGDLISYKIKSQKSFNNYTQKINDLNQTISEMKMELFAHQDTISILSQQKEAQIKLYKTREDKELDKVIALENKGKVLDNIVYKTGQSVQTMNMLNTLESDEVIRLDKESRSKISDLIKPFDYE
nr:hypothetical protein [Tanacetum cinerariifolium]